MCVAVSAVIIGLRLEAKGGVLAKIESTTQRARTDGSVAKAGCILKKRSPTGSYVVVTRCVVDERLKTVSRVSVRGVVFKRLSARGRVLDAGGEAKECLRTKSRVVAAGGETEKNSASSLSRVPARIPSVWSRTNSRVLWQKHAQQ